MSWKPSLPVLVAAAVTLAACAAATPAWGPGTPRDGVGHPVDPVYGTPLPGVLLENGRG
jgi:hypothetical protein